MLDCIRRSANHVVADSMENVRSQVFGKDVRQLSGGTYVKHRDGLSCNLLAQESNASGDVLHPFRRRVVIR